MVREEYLTRLGTLLAGKLSEKEINGILRYYEDYFHEVGPEGEAALIRELGTPEELAERILGQTVPTGRKTQPEPEKAAARRPLPFPAALALIFAGVLLSLIAATMGVSLGASGIICVLVGARLILSSVLNLSWAPISGWASRLCVGGGGVFAAGIGLLLLAGAVGSCRGCSRGALSLFRRIRRGRSV